MLLASVKYVWLAIGFMMAAVGFVIFQITAAQTVHSFNSINRITQVSGDIRHLMRSYDAFRWTCLATSLAALAACPFLVLVALQSRSHRKGIGRPCVARLYKFLALLASILFGLALIGSVMGIAANVKTSDKAFESRKTISSGSSMLTQLSSALKSIQSTNSTSSPVDLVSSLLGLLSGSGSESNSGGSALSALSSAENLQSIYQLVAPMQVGSLVKMLDPAPQSLLQLQALLGKFLGTGNKDLACAQTCVNTGNACICNVAELPLLYTEQSRVLHYTHLSLIGACIMALGNGLMLAIGFYLSAKIKFQQKVQPISNSTEATDKTMHNGLELAMQKKAGGAVAQKSPTKNDAQSVPIQAVAVDF